MSEKKHTDADLAKAYRHGAEWMQEYRRGWIGADVKEIINTAFPLPKVKVPREVVIGDYDYKYRVVNGMMECSTVGRPATPFTEHDFQRTNWQYRDLAVFRELFTNPTVEVEAE